MPSKDSKQNFALLRDKILSQNGKEYWRSVEEFVETETVNAMTVQVFAFVVERHDPVIAAFGDCPRDLDRFRERFALREDEFPELILREAARLVEDSDVEILIETYLTLLERSDHLFVAQLELRLVEIEFRDRHLSLLAIPAIRREHTADVEEDVSDLCHFCTSTARAGAPSSPARRSGRQMN